MITDSAPSSRLLTAVRQCRSTWLALVTAFALTPLSAQAISVQFEKIAKSGDLMPGREALGVVFNGQALQNSFYMGEIPGVLSRPSINDAGAVAFRGTGSHPSNFNLYPTEGLYAKEPNLPLIRLVDDANTPVFPVPGRPAGTFFQEFDPPLLTNDGRVIFHALFGGASSGSGFYWVSVSGGPIYKIVDSLDGVPGWTGVTFQYGFRLNYAGPLLYISANDVGQVVFMGSFKPASSQYQEFGLFGVNLAGGPLVRLVDTTATITPIGSTSKVAGLSQTEGPAINNSGIVLFDGTLANGRPGIFSVPVDGSVVPTIRALQGQSVLVSNGTNRTMYSLFNGHDLNESGAFVFQHAFGSGASDLNAIIAGNLSGGPLQSIIDGSGGDPVPDRSGAAFRNIYYAPLSNAGDLGVYAWDSTNGTGIYAATHSGAPLGNVAQSGQVPPGRVSPATLTNFNSGSAVVNDAGNLAFATTGTDGSATLFGLYFFEECSGQLHRVVDDVTSSNPLPGGLGDCFAGPSCSGDTGTRFIRIWQGERFVRNGHYRSLNNNNQIAFLSAFSTYNAGIYIANVASGGPVQISACPADVQIECPASIDPNDTGRPIATGCGTLSLTWSDSTMIGCGSSTVITRTWTASNGASTATCTQTITLVDSTPPTLTCPADLTVPCDANLPAAYAAWLASANATDACGVPTLVSNAPATPTACGTTTVTWTASDGCNPGTSCIASFTVEDTTPPVISGAADASVPCNPATNAADYAAWLAAVAASDACGVQSFTNDAPPAPVSCGATAVTWIATDRCGLETTVTATFNITDNTAPGWTVTPADLLIECDGAGNATEIAAWLESAVATDECGAVSVSNDYAGLTAACGLTGSVLVTWTATDACGNSSTATATVTIVDSTAPVFTFTPVDLTLECGDSSNDTTIAAWLASAAASDTCGAVMITHDYAGLTATGCGNSGGATVTWTGTDACGNFATVSATLTVEDTTPPTIAAPAAITVGVDSGACYATSVVLGAPTTADNCGPVSVTNDAPAQFPIGTTTVTWTATDACGRIAYGSQTVTVQNLAPVAEIAFQQLTDIGAEARVRLDASATNDAEHANSELTYTWIVDGTTLTSGVGTAYEIYTTYLPFGEHDVTLRVIDPCGEQSEKTVTLVLDPAELSLLEIKRPTVRFCTNPPRLSITGQIGLPLGVDFSEMAPQIFTRVAIGGVEVLPITLVGFDTWGYEDQHWRYVNPVHHALGVRHFRVNWSGNSYQYRQAGFPIELQSDLISTTETVLEVRNRNRRLIPGPFTLDIDGQASITLDPNFTVLASAGLTYDVEVPGKRIALTLPFPLVEASEFTFSGGLARQFAAGADLRASIGRYNLNVFFDEALLPDGVWTLPRTLELDLAVGTQPYPGTAALGASVLDVDPCRCMWRTWECGDDDDDD